LKKIVLIIIFFSFVFGIEYTKEEKKFLKNNPVIYISSMLYWPVDNNGESIHTNYMKLLNKYGNLNLQPVYYKYWSDGFNDAKDGITYGIMALSYSPKREKWFYFTKPYNYAPYYLIVNKESGIHSIKDLKDKKVFIAKNSILREKLKNKFKIIYTKHPYKKLAQKEIDAVIVFYLPKTEYMNKFRIIKTFIDKLGEEHIGINKKYPELYTIITKVMQKIPYKEIEKIRSHYYTKRIPPKLVLEENVCLKDLITPEDIIFLGLVILGFGIILWLLANKKFLNYSIKKFLVSIFIFDILVLGFVVYELLVFNSYSNKILELKSKSFNSFYLVDQIEHQLRKLEKNFLENRDVEQLFDNRYMIAENLLIENQPLKNFFSANYFTPTELTGLAYIQKLINEIIQLQKDVDDEKVNINIYKLKFEYLLNEIKNLKILIKNENTKEISIIKAKLKYQFLLLIFGVLLFVLENIFIFIMIKKKIYNPIIYLTNIIKDYKNGKIICKENNYDDEIGKMIDEFFSLQTQLSQKIVELNKHKENLEEEVKKEVEKRVYQEQVLMKQSRLALMGEMIDVIAHQWKQPLNSISLSSQIIELEKDKITPKAIDQFVQNINMQISHMITTLDEFRSFFRDNKEKEKVCMSAVVKKVLLLLKDDLLSHNIEIETNIKDDFCIHGIQNEFEHILITLLTNAKDIYEQRKIKPRKVIINSIQKDDFYYLEVIDNAGGIDESIIDKIFELNFTTRENGSGVGLYLAKQIAIKHLGDLGVENTQNGAKFYFRIKKDLNE